MLPNTQTALYQHCRPQPKQNLGLLVLFHALILSQTGRGSPWRCMGPASARAHDSYLGFFIRVAPSSPVFFLFFTMPPPPYLQDFWTPNIIASNMSVLNKYTGLMISYYCGALSPRAGKHSFLVKNVSSLSSITLRTLSLLYLKAPFHDLLWAPIVKISCVIL